MGVRGLYIGVRYWGQYVKFLVFIGLLRLVSVKVDVFVIGCFWDCQEESFVLVMVVISGYFFLIFLSRFCSFFEIVLFIEVKID